MLIWTVPYSMRVRMLNELRNSFLPFYDGSISTSSDGYEKPACNGSLLK